MVEDLRLRFSRITDLVAFPEIARLIGIYTAQFGRMELVLWHAYGLVLNMEEDEAMILLGDLQSFAIKLTLVERYFLQKRNDMLGNYSIKLIFEQARIVNTFRNKIAHSQYLTDETNYKLFLQAFASDPNRVIPMSTLVDSDKPNFFELSAERMKDENNTLVELIKSLIKLVQFLKPDSFS
jgi:hypothetical protein